MGKRIGDSNGRECLGCKKFLGWEWFYPYARNGKVYRASYCKVCDRQLCKERYSKDVPGRVAKAKAYRKKFYQPHKDKLRAIVLAAKDRPCADCGVRYPSYVMDFDHQRDKRAAVAKLVSQMVTEEALLCEIAKCEVVCANCHRIRTFKGHHSEQNR
jgi:hypothetical protein